MCAERNGKSETVRRHGRWAGGLTMALTTVLTTARTMALPVAMTLLLVLSSPAMAVPSSSPVMAGPASSPVMAGPSERAPQPPRNPPQPAAVRPTRASWAAPDQVLITAGIEFFGPGVDAGAVSRRRLERWIRRAEHRWNEAPPAVFVEQGRLRVVHLRFELEWRHRLAGSRPTPGFHQIELVPHLEEVRAFRRTGESRLLDGWRSWTYLGGRPGRAGCFGSLIWSTVVAHELGHLFGLRDEYHRHRTRRALIWRTFTGDRRSLMDLSWAPWARIDWSHTARIYQNARQLRWWQRPQGPAAQADAP